MAESCKIQQHQTTNVFVHGLPSKFVLNKYRIVSITIQSQSEMFVCDLSWGDMQDRILFE